MKHALLVTFFGKLRDRFCEYQEPLPLIEKLERAAQVPGVTGVELIFPDECREDLDIRGTLARLNLIPAAINVNIKGDPSFVGGALSSADQQTRRKAVKYIVEAKEFARALGCERVTCAPLADGYDYPFQVNYASAWNRMVECLQEASDAIPEVILHVEHKPGEPRTRGLLDSPAKALRLCRDVGRPQIGVTFNVGHSLFGGGSPAPEFALVLSSGVPCYVHYNDGTVNWDWDLIAGSHRYWELLELLSYAQAAGYDGWFTADTLPLRQDAVELFASNIRLSERLWHWLETREGLELRASVGQAGTLIGLMETAKWVCRTER